MNNATDEERKEILLYNGLYTTSKVLLKSLYDRKITMKEYISESRKMFELWEQLNGSEE